MSLSAQRLRRGTSVVAKETGPLVEPIRFTSKQAVRNVPKNLQRVTEEGIFQGTYLSPSSATQPRNAYSIRSKGQYYKAEHNQNFGGWCLVAARGAEEL